MAIVTYSLPSFAININDWDGALSQLSSSHYQITDGYHQTDVYGSFTYNASGVTGGTVTGMYWTQGNSPVLSMSGLKFDFLDALNASSTKLEQLAFKGNDTFNGTFFNDGFYGHTGNDTFNGGEGRDTVFYDGNKASIGVSASGAGFKVNTLGKVDTLNSIERIDMGDGSVLALDVKAGENAGSAYRIYQAAFDRKPDATGLNYWVKQMDGGASLAEVAMGFVNSNEFKAANPTNDPTTLINSYYQHVLHRAPDPTGAQYWSNAMATGMQASDVLASFSESTENLANTAAALKDGVWM